MSEYRLVMKGVVKTFPGVKALDHAQLELRPGKVMALMGENGAGKSTLMKCMFGIYKMDEGEIEYEGEKVTIPTPLDALNRGIAMVHQELQPIPARTVAENIWLGRYPTKSYGPITVVDHSKMYKDTEELLKKLKLDINPHAKLGSLSIAQMQMVEIAKAVSANCKVLILDEPTSSLTANEVESLFRIMRELKALGVALVYISHKMDEIKVIADEVTIMRDGQYIGKWEVANMTKEQIIAKMVGRELSNLFPPLENHPSDEVMMSLPPTALPIRRTQPARKRSKPPSATTTGITGWMQRQSIRWCSSSAMTAHFISSPSPSVKRTGTGAILPTTGLGQTPCPSPPIPTHGVLTATAIWPSTAIPVWSICFSVRPAKPTRRSSRKPLSGIC